MKIKFNDSKLEKGNIKVSLDSGFTFKDYEIADVKESGIPLDDSQDFNKIRIKGPANILRNLDVVSTLKVEGGQNNQSETPKSIYAWTYYKYETLHIYKKSKSR